MDVVDVMLWLAFGISALIGIVITLKGWRASHRRDRRRGNRWRMW